MPSTESDKPKPKDWWDKTQVIGKTVGSILLPLITAYVGYLLSASIQDRAYRTANPLVRHQQFAMDSTKTGDQAI